MRAYCFMPPSWDTTPSCAVTVVRALPPGPEFQVFTACLSPCGIFMADLEMPLAVRDAEA
jgi:hypothetical protein